MKQIAVIAFFLWMEANSQETPMEEIGIQLEILNEQSDEEIEDDSWMEQLQYFRDHPLNLNRASEEELGRLVILNPLQIRNLVSYRLLLGKLVHINELQAVPGWDPSIIRKLIPFITVNENEFPFEKLKDRFSKGQKLFLLRLIQRLNAVQNPNDSGASKFLGNMQNILLKLQYNYGRQLQFGLLAEKDAGEPMFVRNGFDFMSFHLFARELGLVRKLALGDFQVNFGQGLIQWQGIATRKSANALMIKKQDEIFKPYRSAGEINFHRGLAITLGKGNWEWNAFVSVRKLSANLVKDTSQGEVVSAFLNSGYHRTSAELEDRNKLKQFCAGGQLLYFFSNARVRLNFVQFKFSSSLQEKEEPYQLYHVSGRDLSNGSIDYEYTVRNLHLFGEVAIDGKLNKAFVHGMLLSLDKQLDLSMVIRSISPKYQSRNASAFTEISTPVNETGFFSGICFKPSSRHRIDAYVDVFSFPWLRYGVNAPSRGADAVFQFSYQPHKRLSLYGRLKIESKESSKTTLDDPTLALVEIERRSFRAQMNWDLDSKISIRERMETSLYVAGINRERGILLVSDVNYHPSFKPFDFSARMIFFETGGYDSRIYVMENNALNGFSVPAFFGKGIYFSLNGNVNLTRYFKSQFQEINTVGLWVCVSHTYPGKQNGNARISVDNSKPGIRLQLLVKW